MRLSLLTCDYHFSLATNCRSRDQFVSYNTCLVKEYEKEEEKLTCLGICCFEMKMSDRSKQVGPTRRC